MLAPVHEELGRCPSCHNKGSIGDACVERICAMRGYCYIPLVASLAPALFDHDPLIGQRCGGYLLVSLIGSGGFGRVYRALHMPDWKPAAVKLLPLESDVPGMAKLRLSRYEAEIKALTRLSHPNIVRLFGYGLHRGVPFLAMELIENARTVRAEIELRTAELRGFALDEVEAILVQVLDALEEAHAHQIVHRDIKPENIMLEGTVVSGPFVRVLDFGQAKFTGDGTATSTLLGTPAYMSFEQLTRGALGPWTDFYSIGVLAFELLTGQSPWKSTEVHEMVARKLDRSYQPWAELVPKGYPQELADFIAKTLACDPGDRYPAVAETRIGFLAAVAAMRRCGARFQMIDVRRGSVVEEEPAPPAAPITRRIRGVKRQQSPSRRLGVIAPEPPEGAPRMARAVSSVPQTLLPEASSASIASVIVAADPPDAIMRPGPKVAASATPASVVTLPLALPRRAHRMPVGVKLGLAAAAAVALISVLAPPVVSPLVDIASLPALETGAADITRVTSPAPTPPPAIEVATLRDPPAPILTATAPTTASHVLRRELGDRALPAPAPAPLGADEATEKPAAPVERATEPEREEPPVDVGLYRAVLVTVPTGADVVIDGARVGVSPITMQWQPGDVKHVSVSLAGHEAAGFELSDKQAAKMLTLNLVPINGMPTLGAGTF